MGYQPYAKCPKCKQSLGVRIIFDEYKVLRKGYSHKCRNCKIKYIPENISKIKSLGEKI